MKKIVILTMLIFFVSTIITPFSNADTQTKSPVQIANERGQNISEGFEPEGAVNISQTGQVLYDYNMDKKWYPASMSKLMTMYLTLKAVKDGKLSLDDTVKISEDNYRMSTLPELSNTKLYPGETYTIRELLQITVSASSNAAALILANQVSDSTSDFTDKMNKTAKDIGMNHTHFVNPTGAENRLLESFAPERYKDETRSTATARDFAILSQRVVQDTPKVLDFTKAIAPTQHGVTYYTFNWSLEGSELSLPGTDGLKTGSSDVADYNHTLTTKRDGFRIDQAIMGAGDFKNLGGDKERNKIGNSLMNQSFEQYKYVKVMSKGEHKINGKTYFVEKDLYDVLPQDFTKGDYKYVIEDGKLHIDYDRTFISKDYGPPSVDVNRPLTHKATTFAKSSWSEHPVLTIIGGAFVVAALAIVIYMIMELFRRKK
ncbi:penicillin-binding protein PBP4 [Staphylococcus sp. IVB6181]|uniref:penicillin-binding protein PBP4 n=1 Tax=Staphylococcus sp. IVB6181 TaxID=2929481 RepID=UPI0021D1E061|nr:penicillin-binding protein PBP4 [Staphylococcus sp. IVB6181]UXV34699.1 penicillin-binding protein PBP4 [Staphylococcus sp. IVB6181]